VVPYCVLDVGVHDRDGVGCGSPAVKIARAKVAFVVSLGLPVAGSALGAARLERLVAVSPAD